MELRDQTTLDHAVEQQRSWEAYSKVQQGALLVDLSDALRKRLAVLELEGGKDKAFHRISEASRVLGRELIKQEGPPFIPAPPFRWERMPIQEVERRMPELADWAHVQALQADISREARLAALDLREAGRDLEHHLDRSRTR